MKTNKKNSLEQFPEMKEFWSSLREGVLLLKACDDCGESHFYPRVYCPFCGSSNTRWKKTGNRGTVYSFSIPRRVKPLVAPAVIELEGGVRLLSTIRDADIFGLQIGDSVVVYPLIAGDKTELSFTTEAADYAHRYAARAMTQAQSVPGLVDEEGLGIARAAVIGAGTMGVGITMALANAGIATTLLDVEESSLKRGLARIRKQYETSVSRNRLSSADMQQRLGLISSCTDYESIRNADLVIEAVWEQMSLKKKVFNLINEYAKPGALLGTNTSGLNINEIAEATHRPEDVIGLHFFTPAQSMKLLEVVRGRFTSDVTIARAMAFGRRLSKVPVLVESSPGFVGNRILRVREAQAREMLLDGASPAQVDRVLTEFGMPMGSFELQDMTGTIELLYRRRQEQGGEDWLGDRMYEAGRLGQKVGKGYYRYEKDGRKPLIDPEMSALLEEASVVAGVERRELFDDEVRERLILPMINEACKLIEEGVVARPSDIDAVWLTGYGWPAWRGGILYYADQLGAKYVYERLLTLHSRHGEIFKPAPLLQKIAEAGGRFLETPLRFERSLAFLT